MACDSHTHPQHPQRITFARLEVVAHPLDASAWSASPMWGTRGPFPSVAAIVVAVVTPVVFCAEATEKYNKNTKTSCL